MDLTPEDVPEVPQHPTIERPDTIESDSDEFFKWFTTFANFLKTFISQFKADISAVNDNAAAAADAEAAAETAQSKAETAQTGAENARDLAAINANAETYNPATMYDAGQVALDPADGYRPYTSQQNNNQGNTPSTDAGTWWKPTFSMPSKWDRKTTDFTAVAGKAYKVDAGVTVTFPSSPSDDDSFFLIAIGNLTDTPAPLVGNGKNVMGASTINWDFNGMIQPVFDSTDDEWKI